MNEDDLRKLEFSLRCMKDYLDWENGQFKAPQLPERRNQLMHIFRDVKGHMAMTPGSMAILTALAADQTKYIGTDLAGYRWNTEIRPDGTQPWVRYLDGEINDGGLNLTPQNQDKFIANEDIPRCIKDLQKIIGNLPDWLEWI